MKELVMKTTKWFLVGLIVLGMWSGIASATLYTFNPDVSDWYASGMTAANYNVNSNGAGPLITGSETTYINAHGTWDPTVGSSYYYPSAGTWAGATWTAPANEVIVSVYAAGYFYDAGNFRQFVYGGTAAGTAGDIQLIASPVGETSFGQTRTLTVADGVTQLQFRAWQATTGEAMIAGYASGYHGAINAIIINTEAVPEPATCLFVLISGLGFLARRQNRK
jgi:hypothetical protein